MKKSIKLIVACLALCLGAIFPFAWANAQYATKLEVADIRNTSLANAINVSASALLTEFNKAFSENRELSLNHIKGLSKEGKSAILSMWEVCPFRCLETQIFERGYKTSSGGWQVRNIPLFMKGLPEDEAYEEIAINFDASGNLLDIFFTIDYNQYLSILTSENNEETDLLRRQIVLDFVENFRTAYNRKDISFLEEVYSDDALIITGRVVKKVANKGGGAEKTMQGNLSQEEIEYQVKTKKEYLNGLRKVFKNNQKINIVFDDLSVSKHPKYDELYGVTLRQGWNTSNYSDIGYVFLMIDFKQQNEPKIMVRTWQPEKLNGRTLQEDEIFSLGNFDPDEKQTF